MNAEVTRRIRYTHDDERRTYNSHSNLTLEILENDVDPGIIDASDSETEKGDRDGDRVENFRKNNLRRSGCLHSSRRSARITGMEPQYMDLFCSSEGKYAVLTIDDISNIVQRDECFLYSVDLNESACTSSPATRYLDKATM